MTEQRVASIGDACDFCRSFCRVESDYPWREPVPDLPAPLAVLGARLGGIWAGADHPYWSEPEPGFVAVNLFGSQDYFIDPRQYERQGDDPVRFLEENQGVFSFGFRPGDDRLFVAGDWAAGRRADGWRPVPETSLEDGVVTMLVSNLFWMSMSPEEIYLDPAPRPAGVDRLVRAMPQWGFDGFWTDAGLGRLFCCGTDTIVTPSAVRS